MRRWARLAGMHLGCGGPLVAARFGATARIRTRARLGAAGLLAAVALAGSAKAGSAKVTVSLPIPEKINTQGIRKILVAKFVASDHPRIDPGREIVSFLRREIARGTSFQVLDVEPPNLPEQPVEELLKNYTFWKHVAEEYGADLVVSGRLGFANHDRSGFVQEDVVSPVTGQKVRRTVYAEREDFEVQVDLWFFKGANGALLYKDSFKENQLYEGKSNDALQAFFDLLERLKPDILGVLVPQKRQDPRTIFTD